MDWGQFILTEGDYLLRVIVAALCGLAIGSEREARLKKAGIRTHTIVSMAAALMVCVSKYGFFDVVHIDSVQVDASRVAAGVVTGVGFLGAGIILNRKTSITGITTSAGVWATLGIGMTIGAGMWVLGIGSTVILLVLQYVFHHTMHLVKEKKMGRIHLRAGEEGMPPEQVAAALAEMQVRVIATHLSIGKTGEVEAKMDVLFPLDFDAGKLVGLAKDFPEIVTIDT